MSQHAIRDELKVILGVVVVLWIVFFADLILPVSFNQWGLQPRSLHGLAGIITMPFLHGDFGHLLSNSIPLVILLALMAGSRANSIVTTIAIWLLGGVLLWLFGRSGNVHVGASGLIYGLIAFLICAGYFEKRFVSIIVALVVLFLYGSILLFGVLPTAGKQISWDGHLWGAVAGAAVAFAESKVLANRAQLHDHEKHAALPK
jgi:membrane associated rhomboid family serine protease